MSDKWTIVIKPRYGKPTVWAFDTESEARKRLDTWRMNGRGQDATIVAPSTGSIGVIL